ncbi:MAG: sigma-70 family RNA polymerase sigma factor, partial [Clostridia bacterium]|nr:sigma-70 family RNA polymerase sigma factor [Clostridia bacterium]
VPVEAIPDGAAFAEEDGGAQALRAALDGLPQRLRTMAVLHYMEGYDVREIARMMGTTKGAVCAGLSRAREKLRALIEEEWR